MSDATTLQELNRLNFIRSFGRVFTYLTVFSCLAVAQSNLSAPQADTSHWLRPSTEIFDPQNTHLCAVAAVRIVYLFGGAARPVWDPGAAMFEAGAGTMAIVDKSGLTEATAGALARLEQLVTSLGGTPGIEIRISSPGLSGASPGSVGQDEGAAPQPPAGLPGAPRGGDSAEFSRHRLLVTQRPVSDSDHTRGVGIDAALILPRGARLQAPPHQPGSPGANGRIQAPRHPPRSGSLPYAGVGRRHCIHSTP